MENAHHIDDDDQAAIASPDIEMDDVAEAIDESLQKAKVDSQAQISNLEDADVFKVVSDINKTESALKATLETSGKLIQPSLMEFLRWWACCKGITFFFYERIDVNKKRLWL